MILLLHCMSNVDELSVFEKQELMFDGELFLAFHSCFAGIGDEVDVDSEDSDVRAELCLGLALVSTSLYHTGRFGCNLRSASASRSFVLRMFTDNVTFVFLVSAISKSCFTIELLDFCACAVYEREDLLAIFDGLRFFANVGIARPGRGNRLQGKCLRVVGEVRPFRRAVGGKILNLNSREWSSRHDAL